MGSCPQPEPHLPAPQSLLGGRTDKGTLWSQRSHCRAGRACRERGQGKRAGHVGRIPRTESTVSGQAGRKRGQAPVAGLSCPPAVRLPHPPLWHLHPSLSPLPGRANRLTPAWSELWGLPEVWENLQLWGSLCTRTDTHSPRMHTEAHVPTHTPGHMRPEGWGSRKDPPPFGPWKVRFATSLSAGAQPPLRPRAPREPSPAGRGDRPSAIPLFSLYRLSLPTRHPQTHFI